MALSHQRENDKIIHLLASYRYNEGNLDKVLQDQPLSNTISYNRKDISGLFPANLDSSYLLLIEGAPGIGKTVLSKEIAYQWAKNKLLNSKRLVFLLLLRDPEILKLSSIKDLTQYVFRNDSMASSLSNYLFQTNGKSLIIIFDGYDEMSRKSRNDSLVAKIINRSVLPECGLVITSRPSASLCLHKMADCRVEVLGFAEEDRLDYIKNTLGSNEKTDALQHYLQLNPTINALCYVPLNMNILLSVFEEASMEEFELLNSQTKMYEKFILMKITRYVDKSSRSDLSYKLLNFSDLPKRYNNQFKELLSLAYNALINDQIVFNLNDEVVKVCKTLKSAKWEGLGLLKVTEHANNFSFHFLHFSIQEYLAAYYIGLKLDVNSQYSLLKDTFWDIRYFNTWIMYVGITGGKNIAWKLFLAGNNPFAITAPCIIAKSFLNDKIKSLHIFQCLAESKELVQHLAESKELPVDVFRDKVIDLSNQTLLPKDITTLCFFLLRSDEKKWAKLNLSNCNIRDTGSDILCKTLLNKSVGMFCIDKVDLSHNQIQMNSISTLLDVFENWHTSEAVICEDYDNNYLFEVCLKKFSSYIEADKKSSQTVLVNNFLFAHNVRDQLIDSTKIDGLYCSFSSVNLKLCSVNLSKLHIIDGNMQSDYIKAIVETLVEVDSVYIYGHTLSDEDVNCISSKLRKTSGIWVVIGRTKILGNIPDMHTMNDQFSPIEIFNVTENIKRINSSSATEFIKGRNSGSVFNDFLDLLFTSNLDINFCQVEKNVLIANGAKYDRISEVLSSNNGLIFVFIKKCKLSRTELKIIANLLRRQKSLEKLYIFDSSLEMDTFMYENLLNQTLKLKEIFLHNTYHASSYALTSNVFSVQRDYYANISVLLITNNILIGHNPTIEQMLLSLKLESKLKIWKLYNFPANNQLFQQEIVNTLSNVRELDIVYSNYGEKRIQQCNNEYDNIAKFLNNFKNLQKLSLCHNNLQEGGAGKIFSNLTISLRKLNLSDTNINEQAVYDITKFLSKVEELDLSSNKLRVTGTVELLQKVETITNLKTLNISNNGLNDEAAHGIAIFLSHNPQLRELDLSYNNLKAEGFIKICNGMTSLRRLTKLNISNNNINKEAAHDIAVVLSQNHLLEELDLSYNILEKFGLFWILSSIKNFMNLIKLNICNTGVTDTATDDITTILDKNKKLKELDLSHNNIQTGAASRIFKTTTVNLQKLYISYNDITDDVEGIEAFLSANADLEELDFSHNMLQNAGAKQICKARLKNLTNFNISHNHISLNAADDIAHFLACTTKLEILDLSGNDLQEQDCNNIFNSLENISDLSLLKFSHNNVINEAADNLAKVLWHNTLLQVLDLSYNNISTSDAIKIFKGMGNISNLKTINFSHNMISDEAGKYIAAVLSHNNKLESLDLSSNHFRYKGFVKMFDSLKNVLYLRKLNISHNEITIKAAHSIATFLSLNSKLEELDLNDTILQTPGTIIIFKSLRCFSNLRKLFINNNMITNEAADDIAVVLSHNTKLGEFDISYNNLQAAGAIKIFQGIEGISSLRKLNFAHNKIITDEATKEGLFNNFNIAGLTEFNFSGNNIDEHSANEISSFLSHCTSLQTLNLSCTNLQDSGGINGLDISNKNLLKFNISGNGIVKDLVGKIATFLSKNFELKELDLSCNNLQEKGVRKILKSMKYSNLHKLNIGNNQISDDLKCIADVLTLATKLEELDLSYNKVSADHMRQFLYETKNIFANLIKLNVSGNVISDGAAEALADALSVNTKLKELDLSDNNLHAEGISKIFNGLRMSTLIKLNISSNDITGKAADDIVNVLSRNIELEKLDISQGNVHNDGAIKIFTTNITKLSTLNISCNSITTEAADVIAAFLSRNKKLVEFNLSCNKLQSTGVIKLCKTKLSNILNFNISYNNVTTESINEIGNFLTHNTRLQVLDLSNNNLQGSGCWKIFIKNLQDNSGVSGLKITNSNVISEAADELEIVLLNNPKMKDLDLSFNNSDMIKVFTGMKNMLNLVKINISHNSISDEAADKLATVLPHNISLQELDLSYNDLSASAVLKILKGMKSIFNLIKINISHNMITNETADELANLLLHNTKLKELHLSHIDLTTSKAKRIFKGMKNILNLLAINVSHNDINDEITDELAIIFCHNPSLQEVDISHGKLSTSGAVNIFKGMKNISKLVKLNISHNTITDKAANELANVLFNNTSIQKLNLSCNHLTTCAINVFKGMKNIINLTVLNISHNMITDEAANYFGTALHNTLRKLDLSFNHLTASGFCKILKSVSNLTVLNISHNMITDEAAENLATILSHNDKLESLDLSYNCFGSKGCIKIFTGINLKLHLRKLNISCNHITTNEAAECIANFLNHNLEMEELDISNNFMQAAGIRKIFECMRNVLKLKKLYIHHNMFTNEAADEVVTILSQNTKLEELDMSHNNLQTASAINIFQSISHISTLTKLDVAHNMINDEATRYILSTLHRNDRLRVLKLNHNDLVIFLTKCNFTNLQELDLSYTSLKTAVSIEGLNVVTLKKCKISGNYLGASTANSIASFLSRNDKLQELDLSCNNLQESGTRNILKALKISNLKSLNISNNQISSDLKYIADVLTLATKLEELDLSYNKLSADHMKQFLYETKNIFANLIKLNVSGNVISDGAAEALADALSVNTKLIELDLSDNNLHAEGISKIFNGLRMSTLIELNISNNSITDKAADDIANFLSINNKIEKLEASSINLQDDGAKKILGIDLSELTTFNISQNNITSKIGKVIVDFLSRNTKLQSLDLSCNDLQELTYRNIFEVLQNTCFLITLKFSHCNSINKVTSELTRILLLNVSLQELDISYNKLSTSDAVKIFQGMRNILNLKKLNISHNMITDEAADYLGTVLHNSLQKLDLSFNHLTASGFCKILKSVSNLTVLNIGHNMITDEAAENLATILSHNDKLESLDLSYNCFGSKGCIKIFTGINSKLYLRKLNISCNHITTNEAAECIANFLNHNLEMEELDISNNFMQAAGIRKIFECMINILRLKKLYMHHNMITNEAADAIIETILTQNAKLEELDMSHNNLLTASVINIFQSISYISTLTKLDVAHNMINDEATRYILSTLHGNNQLRELNLSHNNLVISNLAKCNFTNLQELDLSYTSLPTAVSIKGLNVVTLRKCKISGNYLTASVANSIASFLSRNDELQELDLSCNNLQESGTRNILNSLKRISNLKSLNISNNQISGDLKYIADVLTLATKLEKLDLSYNKLSTEYMKYFLYKTKNIFANFIKLNVSGNVISDGATEALADALSANTKLIELDLSDNNLHAEGISKIFNGLRMSTLIKLSISHNNISGIAADDIANFFRRNSKLEELSASHNNLHDADTRKILKASLSEITALNISHNNITTEVGDAIAEFLSHNTKLKIFDISCNNMQESRYENVFKALQNISSLTSLNLSKCNVVNQAADALGTVLLCNTSLQDIDISYNNLSMSDAVKIFKGMQNISNLVKVNVSHNMITDEATDELATVLLNNISLQKLDFSYSNLSVLDAVKIFKGMKNISNLISINISHNMITDEAVDKLATVLLNNISLQKLDLSYNNLAVLDSVKIFKALKRTSKLRAINVSHNMITDEAAESLSTILSHNSDLETLNLSYNDFTSKGFNEIFKGMKEILYLRSLDISHAKITFEATRNIGTIVGQNKKLEELDISYNDVQTLGAIKILKSVKFISTLTKFNIAHNMIAYGATNNIFEVLDNNSKLKELNFTYNSQLEKDVITKIIASDTMEKIATKLSIFITNLQELDLSNMNLQMRGIVKVFKCLGNYICTLTKFNISKNSITPPGADYLAEFLSRNSGLQELDLSHNNLEESGIIKILDAMKCSNLTKLNISTNNINLQDTVYAFSNATRLIELDLSCNRLNDAENAKFFFTKAKIIFLNLMKLNVAEICCEIDDAAAVAIAEIFSQNDELKELDLSYNELCSKAICKILNKLNPSALIKFNISHNNISDEAACDIANFLSKCTKLEVLNLSHNSLHDTSAKIICKTNLPNLISFDISHNKISIAGADDVAKFLSRNSLMKEYNLSGNGLLELAMINIFKNKQVVQSVFSLSELNISHSNVINERVNKLIAVLLCSTHLRKLDLSYNNLSTSDAANIFKGLENNSSLEIIDVSHNMITDEAAHNLATVLSQNNKIRSLDFSFNYLTESGAIVVFKGMTNSLNLRELNIGHNLINDEAAESMSIVLSKNKNLHSLDLSYNYFGSETFVKLFNYLNTMKRIKLRKLNISGNKITATAVRNIAVFLSHNCELEEFDFGNNGMQAAGLIKIFENISLRGLKRICFNDNMVTDEAASHIATVLKRNTELKEINMSGNKLLSDGIKVIFRGMKNILKLTQVNISHNCISFEAADDIAIVLSKNINLQALYLCNNCLQAKGIITLLSGMNTITAITHLDISSNEIDDEAADDIANFLHHNYHLEVLDLSNNLIQTAGATRIFGRVYIHFGLKKLNLSGNALDDEAADIIGMFLSRNPSLEEFNIGKNELQALGAVKIFKAIQYCPNILKLDMSNNKITDEAGYEIAAVLSTVTKLQEVDLDCNLLSANMSDYIKRAFIKLPKITYV